MAPLVKDLPSYIKDTKHALQILQNIHFHGTHKFIFTMDVKSLYTVIPHHDGLRALKFFLDKRPNRELSTSVLVRLAELVLTLNNFSIQYTRTKAKSAASTTTKLELKAKLPPTTKTKQQNLTSQQTVCLIVYDLFFEI